MLGDVLNGLAFGSLLFILASGFTLALGLVKVVNIAHGAFYMLGVYISISVMKATGSFALAIVASCIAVMAIGALMQALFLKRFYLRPLPQMLFTMGLTLVIAEVARIIWGSYPQVMKSPTWLNGILRMGTLAFPKYRAFVIVMAAIVALALYFIIERTRIGALVRACIDDQDMARSMGINIDNLFTLMLGFVGLLAGLGGAIGAAYLGTYQGVHFEILTFTLVVVVLGGLGSVPGALLGSLLIGVIDSVGKVLFPDLAYFLLFGPMILMLSIKPTGLLGRE